MAKRLNDHGRFCMWLDPRAIDRPANPANPANFIELISGISEISNVVTCHTPNGTAIEVEPRDKAHAIFLKKMNPKPVGYI